ncbi:putative metallopeptidase [Leishmania major strain Friedlin]|uniref:Putative metallopeptidase n=1 Tax=Leishmania major TaxID=5664 RepID=Q4QET4_LEIMA|nr:putative metallopeptidase [Leishmania major strain Friedlin]CAG9572120.1 COP9_signalosome_complex_subunit_5_-_putative [Leishmania major strain Friedlin]CAJ03680.1 putative metallopeptidase [Leishmania major strain Friedlin]|eukprot:XP_001682164.1 putative metallopeptidase [Leishmania major strain Friedlin]
MSTSVASPAQRSSGQSQWSLSTPVSSGPQHKLCSSVPIVSDAYWTPDFAHMETARQQKPWRFDSLFFESVSVSLAATVKMFLHGTRGCPDMSQGRFNWFEVMGLLIGHFSHRELILTDSFSLPVAASEVECSMTEASQIYMANYLEYHRRLGKAEPGCLGWYHTHPGYSCFLSGIDVTTQQGSQQIQDPWVALVIDPVKTLQTGQFSMKAFRTYPGGDFQGQRSRSASHSAVDGAHPAASPANATAFTMPDEYGIPPSNRVKEFGMHAHRYYELPVRIVQSARDAPLWELLQRHFWPLSLSLTFPFAPSTRICHCCSAELAKVVSALGARAQDSCTRERSPLACDGFSRGCVGSMPLLYQSSKVVGSAQACSGGDGSADADDVAEMEQRLLAITGEVLRVRAESFSLIGASHPVHAELLAAMRAVAAAAEPATTDKRHSCTSLEIARNARKEASFSSLFTSRCDDPMEEEEEEEEEEG